LVEEVDVKTIAVSGGFDPLHFGHLRMFQDAAKAGDVIIILNSDEWLRRKKGYVFMPYAQRAEILYAIKGVMDVVNVDDSDGTVCEALRRLRPDYFANGGDRTEENTPELKLCCDLGIKTLFNIGGEKVASSSELVTEAMQYHDW
jgi:cytidyltransferase-like protein